VAAAARSTRAATQSVLKATVEAVHEAVCARPCARTLNTTNHDSWRRGERLDGRGAVQVAVQQRVAGTDTTPTKLTTTTRLVCQERRHRQTAKKATATGVVAVNGGTSSKVGGATVGGAGSRWSMIGWEGGLKKVGVDESRGSSGEQE
jgi:hypothetical protein